MNLFLINTPTQLLNAIALIYGSFREEKCDAYYTENLKSFFQNSDIAAVFENAYEITLLPEVVKRSNAVNKAIVRIKNALDFGKVKASLPSNPKQYKRVFASGVALRNYEIYYAVKTLNKNVSLELYEEGLCEYYKLGEKKHIAQILFSYFFFRRYYMKEAEHLYVYQPSAAACRWDNIQLAAIPRIQDPELIRIINSAFRYAPSDLAGLKNKVIVLEQAFYSEAENAQQERIISLLADYYGEEKIVIKLHPRSDPEKYAGKYQCSRTRIPLEIISLNEDITHNTFVSISSSAVLNFKLMLDLEPDIIVMNRMNREKTLDTDAVFDYVRDNCRKKNFWIPANMEEFEKTVEFITKNEAKS